MKIGGFLKQSFIDYPGHLASVVFTKGCNFKCGFCHNPELVLPNLMEQNINIEIDSINHFLNKNKKMIDAIVITGGEPTIHDDLEDFIVNFKNIGFKIKLDTNGTNPKQIKNLLDKNLLSYVAMDIKTSNNINKYSDICGVKLSEATMNNIELSVDLIKNSNIDYEFRTTLVKEFHTLNDFKEIAKWIKGTKKFTLQKTLKNNNLIDNNINSFDDDFFIDEIKKILNKENILYYC